jgi:hypothetical protein
LGPPWRPRVLFTTRDSSGSDASRRSKSSWRPYALRPAVLCSGVGRDGNGPSSLGWSSGRQLGPLRVPCMGIPYRCTPSAVPRPRGRRYTKHQLLPSKQRTTLQGRPKRMRPRFGRSRDTQGCHRPRHNCSTHHPRRCNRRQRLEGRARALPPQRRSRQRRSPQNPCWNRALGLSCTRCRQT